MTKSSEDDSGYVTTLKRDASQHRMPYWKLYYHLVWATFERQPLIDAEREAIIHTTLDAKAKELRAVLHAFGSVADHVHVVISIPPVVSVAACVKHLKGTSSRAANARTCTGEVFRWQEGYGVLSLGERSLATVIGYVRDQRRHHGEGTTVDVYETIDDASRLQSSSDDFFAP